MLWTTPPKNASSDLIVEADLPDKGRIEMWGDLHNDQLHITFVLHRDGQVYSSANTEHWPVIERALPRSQWPVAHPHGGGEDPILEAAVQTWIAAWIDE